MLDQVKSATTPASCNSSGLPDVSRQDTHFLRFPLHLLFWGSTWHYEVQQFITGVRNTPTIDLCRTLQHLCYLYLHYFGWLWHHNVSICSEFHFRRFLSQLYLWHVRRIHRTEIKQILMKILCIQVFGSFSRKKKKNLKGYTWSTLGLGWSILHKAEKKLANYYPIYCYDLSFQPEIFSLADRLVKSDACKPKCPPALC